MSRIYDIKNQIEEDDFNGLSYSAQVSNHFAQENERKLISQQLKDYEQIKQDSKEALKIANKSYKIALMTFAATIIILILTALLLF